MNLEKFIIIGLCILYFICLNFIFWYAIYLFILTKKYCIFNNLNSENLHQSKSTFKDSVLIQLPVYNEKHVIERLIDSVCKIEYPRNLLQIDILDDSDDNTSDIIKSKVSHYQKSGININHKIRKDRKGYKAGALDFFMKKSNADFIVIFDADFIPPKDFILKLIPYFDDQNIGMIQSKWGHLNKDQSILTRVQAFALNFHFTIEQLGRNTSDYFINFNGTSGIWRKKCIEDAGGWSANTLTEDLDLSYRAQLKGWKFKFVSNLISDAELPTTMAGLKTQQYRWNKGGAQCFKKLYYSILSSKSISIKQKIFALTHLFSSTLYLFVFMVFLLSFILIHLRTKSIIIDTTLNYSSLYFISTILICYCYWISWKKNENNSKIEFFYHFIFFLTFTCGLSFHNLTAVISGYFSNNSEFKRTPKYNSQASNNLKSSSYFKPLINYQLVFEILFALLFIFGIVNSIIYLDIFSTLFFTIPSLGFGIISYHQIKEYYTS